MPLFAPGFKGEILDLTVTLSQILFPILILLGISGVVVGILNSYDRFGAFAISPLFWNLTIIVVLVLLMPAFHGQDRIYAYAIGILVGTLVQLLIPAWDLRHTPFKFNWSFEWRNPGVRRVLLLMLPVTISLGLINFNMLINSFFGSLVSDQAPAAIDKAFRIYQLPQGIFSVAIATVLFPTLARFATRGEIDNLRATMANGMRQILFVLLPAAAAVLALSEPMIRLVYQRGDFDPAQTTLVATALFWFAFSLPTNGLYLLQTRTFFSLQRPWMATGIAGLDLVVSALAALALYKPFGVGGIVAGTGIGTTAPRSSPRRWSCAASSAAWSWAGCSRPACGSRRRGGPGGGRLRRLGRPRPGPRARPGRPDRLARRRPRRSAASSTSRWPSSSASPSWSRSRASCAAARCSAPGATCWASPRSALLAGFARLGASALRARLLPGSRGRPGLPRDRGPRARDPDLGRRAARQLRRVRGRCLYLCVVVVGLAWLGLRGWSLLAAGWRGTRGVGTRLAAPQLRPGLRPPTGPAGRSVDVATLIALAIAVVAVIHFAAGCGCG